MSVAQADFQEAMRRAGLEPPPNIEPGKLIRFSPTGKRGDDAGWCKLFDDGQGGVFGDWRSGLSEIWQAQREQPMSRAESDAFRTKCEAARREREAEEARRHTEAATKAAAIWQGADVAPLNHAYLLRKGIEPHGARIQDGALVLPMRDASGALASLQFIDAEGGKRFLPGGRVTGCYYAIGKPAGVLCIAEGFATGASVHQATGHAVAVAFNAGNLLSVAQALRGKFPDLRLVICADDDFQTPGNPGMANATKAGQSVGGLLAVPDFGADRPEGATDFNDLHRAYGLGAVKTSIERATEPSGANAPAQALADADSIANLAALSPLDYDRCRKAEAEALGIRPGTLDKLVMAERKGAGDDSGAEFSDVDPWPQPVDGLALLRDLSATVRRFIVCDHHTAIAASLWVAMTHLMDVVDVAPLAVITAPEKRCGKSQLLTLLGKLAHRPLTASNISPAALFRAVDAWKPTLLVDEADTFMRENEELRGILNAGHTRDSAYVVRVVGEDFKPTKFSVWGAKALAGIGHLADTLMDRAIVLELRRKLPHESVERLRHAEPGLFDDLASKLARWAEDNRDAVRRARPELPASLNDRAQDNWEPLLAIAHVAGGKWPELGRQAALKLSGADSPSMTVGTELLADIQEIFEHKKVLRITSADLIEALCADDEKPWATYNRGKPITPRQISKRLGEYGIKPKTVRVGYDRAKGYELGQFIDAFSRYLSSTPPASVTTLQPNNHGALSVTDAEHVTVPENPPVTPKPAWTKDCHAVTDKKEVDDEY